MFATARRSNAKLDLADLAAATVLCTDFLSAVLHVCVKHTQAKWQARPAFADASMWLLFSTCRSNAKFDLADLGAATAPSARLACLLSQLQLSWCFKNNAGPTPSLIWLTWEQQQRSVQGLLCCSLRLSCHSNEFHAGQTPSWTWLTWQQQQHVAATRQPCCDRWTGRCGSSWSLCGTPSTGAAGEDSRM